MTSATQALVIGNGAYPEKLRLNNPARDAAAVKAAFVELAVDVTYAVDFPYDDLLSTIEKFLSEVNRRTVTVSILYYSGHGIQDNDINYMVPIDFKDPAGSGTNRLISIQSIIDRMVNATSIRIVLLDACRTGKDLKQVVATGTRGIEIDRTFKLDNMVVSTQGLAEIKAASDTFIAFAAGPDQVALDGVAGGLLSPFTGALVKHLASVDLPLSNLTSRVRQEVLDETGQTQRTWDQSSLRAPYYFNPGSLLLFAGNLMALIGLMISTAIYSLVLASPGVTVGWVAAALGLPPENVRPFGTTVTSPIIFGVVNLLPERPCRRSRRSVSFLNASASASAVSTPSGTMTWIGIVVSLNGISGCRIACGRRHR
jgi:Caspase domain